MEQYKNKIQEIWNNRELLNDPENQKMIREVIDMLDQGGVRVAEFAGGEWKVNQWVKMAVILYFPIQKMQK
ncbi:MAG: 2,3,4,5-tetrahydropyridine-2,6-dicarboxylate N-succinyltransferase, partial [Bacteroidota bacterium]